MTTWWHRMFGDGTLHRHHRVHWFGRLFHRADVPREVLDAREARAELSSLLTAATREADAIMAKLEGPKAGRHG